jgi:uridylate kinase
MKKVVISLGGSIVVPDKVNYSYLKNFKKLITNFSKRNKVVIVVGGGSTARKYMKKKFDNTTNSRLGITATRLNARLVNGIFNKKEPIPIRLTEVKKELKSKNIVVCGALGYKKSCTTDGNAAQVAKKIKAEYLINMTNVKGLYDKNPKTNKSAKLIKKISFKDFLKMINKIKFQAGQHFVLDQFAAKLIARKKIKTYIIGPSLVNLKKVLSNKKFIGTTIS